MAETNSKKLAVFDTDRFFNRRLYDALETRGVDITPIVCLNEIQSEKFAGCAGFLAHPGIENQKEFFMKIRLVPNIKVAVFSGVVGDYDTTSSHAAVFYIEHTQSIYEYFFPEKGQEQ